MSELKVELLRGRLNPDRPPAVQKADFLKAWASINFASTTQSIRDSFGVSTLTDAGVGSVTANLATAMVNQGDFPCVSCMGNANGNTAAYSLTAASVSVQTVGTTWANADSLTAYLSLMVSGDLA